jgi:hypothetical protein
MEAVERHFRENHKDNIIKPAETHTLSGVAARALRSPELARLVRSGWEDQRRFPLQIATVLSQQFAAHGLQFFKVNKTITHVSVARPHYLDLTLTPVSDGVKRIVDFINAHPKCTRRQLVEALAPSPPAETTLPVSPEGSVSEASLINPNQPTADQTAVVSDLHWLIHQGHVIEFANGTLETAKKPIPKPPKPESKPAEKPAELQPEGAFPAQPATPEGQVSDSTHADVPASELPAEPTPITDPAAAESATPTAPEAPAENPSAPALEGAAGEFPGGPPVIAVPEPPADPVESPS